MNQPALLLAVYFLKCQKHTALFSALEKPVSLSFIVLRVSAKFVGSPSQHPKVFVKMRILHFGGNSVPGCKTLITPLMMVSHSAELIVLDILI